MKYTVYGLADGLGIFYIGQTSRYLIERIKGHLSRKSKTATRVREALLSNSLRILMLASSVSKLEALRLESYYIKKALNDGFTLLNSALFNNSTGHRRSKLSNELIRLHSRCRLIDSFGNIFNTLQDAAKFYRVSATTIGMHANNTMLRPFRAKKVKLKGLFNRPVIFKWVKEA